MLSEKNQLFTVVRKTLPALKATAYKDFMDIVKKHGIFNENNLNKSDLTYRIGTNEIEFISVDQPQKIRGRKRDYLWCNEANELEYDDYQQLILRTRKQCYMDYNPSDEYHWIYEKVLVRTDCTFIQSTYKDNPFIDDNTIREIERLQNIDANYWRIYGLGEKGVSETIIYKNWNLIDSLPPDEEGDVYYGIDFGFNNETAMIKVVEKDRDIYVKELIYESGLTNADLIKKVLEFNIGGLKYIYCDSAEPQRIKEFRRANLNARPANKDVLKGIDTLKSRKIYVTKDSVNLIKELRSYRWKEKDGKPIDEPVKVNDHLCFTKDTIIANPFGKVLSQTSTGFQDIYEFMGSKVTANHPYLTQRGFIPLDTLRYSDKIILWKNKSLMELSLDDTQTLTGVSLKTILYLHQRNASAIRQNACTGIYGKNIMVKHLKVFTSTIKTTIHLTMIYLISNLLHLESILWKTMIRHYQSGRKVLRKLFRVLVSGVKHQKDTSSDTTAESEIQNTSRDTVSKGTATSVEKNILPKHPSENFATIIAKLKHLGKEEVFATLTDNGYFLANGVLVSNCDALRYSVHSTNTQPFFGVK